MKTFHCSYRKYEMAPPVKYTRRSDIKSNYMKSYRKRKKKDVEDLVQKVKNFFTNPSSRDMSLDDLISQMRLTDRTWRNLCGKPIAQPPQRTIPQISSHTDSDVDMSQVNFFYDIACILGK